MGFNYKENGDNISWHCTNCKKTLIPERPKWHGRLDMEEKEYQRLQKHIKRCKTPLKKQKHRS